MVEECLARLPEQLREVSALPGGTLPDEMPETLLILWKKRAEEAAAMQLPAIYATDWLRYSRTGDRAEYESRYFPRRRRLTDLVCGALAGEPGLEDAILDTIWAICEETAWQLPAHNTYIRDTPSLEWPDPERPIVDLFAAETGGLLACASNVLGKRLPGEAHRRVSREIERRILTPYLHEHFWWMGNGEEPMCNWTTWCTQNVLLCALMLPQTDEVRRAVIRRAAGSLDCFLKDYGEDGCCNEGAHYYNHAGLCLFGCLELLCAAAPGAFDSLWHEPKIRAIAAYIFRMHISGPYYVNFADCSPVIGRRGAREFCFARRTENLPMAIFAARDWKEGLAHPEPDADISRINLWYQMIEAAAAEDMLNAAQQSAPAAGDCFLSSAGVLRADRGSWQLAAKAGCNGDSHNHNDTGSVILYRDGRPVLIDLGVETYTQKTFSPQRYEIWTMQSAWHNLPTFDGVMQEAGAQYAASDVETRFEPQRVSMKMELAGAWPKDAGLDSFVRTLTLTEDGLKLHDACRGTYRSAFLSLLTCDKPVPEENGLSLPGLAGLRIETDAGAPEIDCVEITDARLRIAWPRFVYRIRIPFMSDVTVTVC